MTRTDKPRGIPVPLGFISIWYVWEVKTEHSVFVESLYDVDGCINRDFGHDSGVLPIAANWLFATNLGHLTHKAITGK